MQFAPIALFTYNRLIHTKRTVDALRLNRLAAESELVVFSDGPRSVADTSKVEEVREYIANISGFRKVRVVPQSHNLGLARSIIRGVTEMVAEHGRVIVLEDDMVTSRFFLQYMNEALVLYQDAQEVASIHGYVYPVAEQLPETFFLRGADCWGWGTWKRSWLHFEENGVLLLEQLRNRNLLHEFDYFGTAGFSRMLEQQTRGRNDSWAVRWYASAFLRNMVTLYPGRSLVCNIGSDSSGEHCGSTNAYDVGSVAYNKITVTTQPPVEDSGAKAGFSRYFRAVAQRKMVHHLRQWLQKMTRFSDMGVRAMKKLLHLMPASSGYVVLKGPLPVIGTTGWEDIEVAHRQHKAFVRLLQRMQSGSPRADFVVLAKAVAATGLRTMTLLEIGCGSGWNIEVLRCLSKPGIRYTGLDCSAAMLAIGRAEFPGGEFIQGDAMSVPFPDRQFDLVVSGTVLMHLPDFRGAIGETKRLANRWCIFHTVTVIEKGPTINLQKKAYGKITIEVVFNETELLQEFALQGLRVVEAWNSIPYNLVDVIGEESMTRTYLCERLD